MTREAPDAHWELRRGAQLVGRYSAWWSHTPKFHGRRVGFIGHFSVDNRYVTAALQHACGQLSAQGCALAVGPVDGSTWRSYRLVTERGSFPRFFLEPDNPPQLPELFRTSGFEPIASYFSALCNCLDNEEDRVTQAQHRLRAAGVRIRPLQKDALESDLLSIFSVARTAFRGNLLYTEPTAEEFLAECRSLAACVPDDFVLLAEHAGRPVGFVFALPDLLQRERGEKIDTIIVKTLAALPERRLAGLGQCLLSAVQRRADKLGFRRAIHALVRDAGHLRRISGRSATTFRQYTLFAKDLQP